MRCNYLKCFIFANASGYGGAERSLELLIAYWQYHLDLYIFVENKKSYEKLKHMASQAHVYRLQSGNSLNIHLKNIISIRHVFFREHPRYWISNTNKGALYLSVFKFLYHIPSSNIMVFIRDYQWKYSRLIFSILRDVTIAVPNQATLEYGKNKKFKFNKKNIYVTDNPVMIHDSLLAENEVGKYDDNKYIVMLANISRWKGIIYALQAFALSRLNDNGIKLIVLGKIVDPSYYDECQTYIDKYRLYDSVEIREFCENTGPIYANCMMLLNTSLAEHGGPETFGRTIIEAWSYKKPVIAFSEGGPKYLISDNIDGLLIPEKDVQALASAMNKLVKDSVLRREMGKAGYEKVKNRFDSKIVAKNILAYINNHME